MELDWFGAASLIYTVLVFLIGEFVFVDLISIQIDLVQGHRIGEIFLGAFLTE
jgi:hypothetical protein